MLIKFSGQVGISGKLSVKKGSESTLIEAITTAGLTSGLQLVLDAGDINSYSSGQTWTDVAGVGNYDVFRGDDGSATSTDPTFNGTPGGLTDNEYWSSDGGDYFIQDNATDDFNLDVVNTFHQNNATLTIITIAYITTNPAGSGFCGTGGNFVVAKNGFAFRSSAVGPSVLNFAVGKVGGPLPINLSSTGTFTHNAWHVLGVSVDEAAGAGGGRWLIDDDASETFNSTYASSSGSAATEKFTIMDAGGGGNQMPSGSRIAGMMVWNTVLSETNMTDLSTIIQTRFGI